MPRSARFVVPGYPHHIIQRGHNRQTVFFCEDDYLFYLNNLREWKEKLGCLIYAYCLMTNHIHLIIDPCENPENLAKLMKRVASRQTRYVNKLEKRTGSLWEGRYKSSPICTSEYLLSCCRYVELNPVRAKMAADPAEYPWPSYRFKTEASGEDWLNIDPCYLALAGEPRQRAKRYSEFVMSEIPEDELLHIRQSLQRGQLTGSLRFIEEIEKCTERRVEFRVPREKRGQIYLLSEYLSIYVLCPLYVLPFMFCPLYVRFMFHLRPFTLCLNLSTLSEN